MEMPWAERKALASRMHKIDIRILTGYAGMYNFVQLFGLRLNKEWEKFLDDLDDIKPMERSIKKKWFFF